MADSLLTLIDAVVDAARELGDGEAAQRIRVLAEHSREAKLQVLIAGSTGSGRASLVNGLLGCDDLVPITAVPKAPVSLILRHGSSPTVELVASDGGRMAVPAQSVRGYLIDPTTAKGNPALEMWAPCPGLEMCDLRVEPVEAGDRDWRSILAGVDVVIVVLNGTAPLSQAERDFIRDQLASGYGLQRAVIAVTRMDLVPEEERESVLELVRRFLGPYESQPVLVQMSAAEPIDEDHPLRIVFRDLLEQRETLRTAALRESIDVALEKLGELAEREHTRASLDRNELGRLRDLLASRQDWLQGRIARTQHRVDAFVGTLLLEQMQREVQETGEVLRRRLPDEIRAIDETKVIKRYLPGYLETVWREVLEDRLIASQDALIQEARHLEEMIDRDIQELTAELPGSLRDLLRDFEAAPESLRSFVMPSRGKHTASTVVRGLSLYGFGALIIGMFLGISPAMGLLSLGAGQLVQRIYRKDILESDREAIIASAVAAERDIERELQLQIGEQFAQLAAKLRVEVASRYTEAIARLQDLLAESDETGETLEARRARFADLAGSTIPELRSRLRDLTPEAVG